MYILKGDESTIAKILKENRIRVNRGLVTFTPMAESEEVPTDEKEPIIEDSKEVHIEDEKKPKKTKKSK